MSEQPDTQIINETLISHFSMIPNILTELSLSPYAIALYLRIVRRAGWQSGGACWENSRNLAQSCRMSKSMVSNAKKELVGAGLIRVEKIAKGHGEFPYDRITLIDIWRRNFEHFSTCPQYGQDLSTTEDRTVHQEGLKNIPSNNIPHTQNQQGAHYAHLTPRAKSARGGGRLSPLDDEFNQWFAEKRKHPALQAIKTVTGSFPPRNRQVYERIIEILGNEPDIPRLEWAHGEWTSGKNGNPQKILKWLQEGYIEGFYYNAANYLPMPE